MLFLTPDNDFAGEEQVCELSYLQFNLCSFFSYFVGDDYCFFFLLLLTFPFILSFSIGFADYYLGRDQRNDIKYVGV